MRFRHGRVQARDCGEKARGEGRQGDWQAGACARDNDGRDTDGWAAFRKAWWTAGSGRDSWIGRKRDRCERDDDDPPPPPPAPDLTPATAADRLAGTADAGASGNLLANDTAGDGGTAALRIVSVEIGGTAHRIPPGGTLTLAGVTSEGGRTGTLTLGADGELSFEPAGFGSLRPGDAPDRVAFTYTVRDADGDLATGAVEIAVSPAPRALVVQGNVTGPATATHVTVLIDLSQEARTLVTEENRAADLNGDGIAGSMVDEALAAVIDIARSFAAAGLPSQPLTLVAFGTEALPPLTLTVAEILAAFGETAGGETEGGGVAGAPNPFAALGRTGDGFADDPAAAIDLDAALAAAASLADADPETQDLVWLIAGNTDFADAAVPGSTDFTGDALADLRARAVVETVLVYREGLLGSGDPDEALGILDAIDSDGRAALVTADPGAARFAGRGAVTDIADAVDVPADALGGLLARIDQIDIIAGGRTLRAGIAAGDAPDRIAVGAVAFEALEENAAVAVRVTLADGSVRLFEDVADRIAGNDTFDFEIALA